MGKQIWHLCLMALFIVIGEGNPLFNGYRAKSIELDTLPFPAYEKLDGYPQAYQLPIFNYPRVPNSSCISSRGCPYACSYCDRSVFRNSFRYNSAEYLYEHLKYLKDRFHIRHINFYDDQFTFNRKRVEAFTRFDDRYTPRNDLQLVRYGRSISILILHG